MTQPVELECPACRGAGCQACDGTGRYAVTGCPLTSVPAEAWQLAELADLAERGMMPEPGGTLDQPAAFWPLAGLAWADKARHEAEAIRRAR